MKKPEQPTPVPERGNREFFENLIDQLHDGVVFVDRDRKITFWNLGAEELTGYPTEKAMGQFFNTLLLPVSDQGKTFREGEYPIAKTLADGQIRNAEVFLRHRDGHRVPVEIKTIPIRDAKGDTVGVAQLFRDNYQKVATREKVEEMERMSLIDPLTGLPNRRYLETQLTARIEQLQRYGWPFGILLIDIDHFQQFNQTFSREVGDKILTIVARTLAKTTRSFDFLGRWEEDKFIVILVNVNKTQLFTIANRFRFLVQHSGLSKKELGIPPTVRAGGNPIHVTISIGACLARPTENVDALLHLAGQNLLQSKQTGGNRVTMGGG